MPKIKGLANKVTQLFKVFQLVEFQPSTVTSLKICETSVRPKSRGPVVALKEK